LPPTSQVEPVQARPEPEPEAPEPEEEPPPISGAVESQRLQKRPASSAPPAASPTRPPPAPAPTEITLAVEPPPPPAPLPPAIAAAQPVVVEIAADIARRDPIPGPAARFVAASLAYAPASFGELLDASLELGATLVESMADRS
jgi:hypothetical protein